MRAHRYPWNLCKVLNDRPNLGGLMDLCEENYRVLCRLVPNIRQITGYRRSRLDIGLDLHLEVLEQTPYTSLLHLTYYFPDGTGVAPDPDTTFRVYHDAGQVEVLDLRQTALPLPSGPRFPDLCDKWRVNLFLSKWLQYCVSQGHCFADTGQSPAPGHRLAVPC
jgi:uncharacterized protein YqiB (DUF1249 family)